MSGAKKTSSPGSPAASTAAWASAARRGPRPASSAGSRAATTTRGCPLPPSTRARRRNGVVMTPPELDRVAAQTEPPRYRVPLRRRAGIDEPKDLVEDGRMLPAEPRIVLLAIDPGVPGQIIDQINAAVRLKGAVDAVLL